ncbi:MAG TPA: stage III sporulation protein AF [Clostridia bacterium]|nr:stage III sporulation protein AF [Clostridia bacterium]
MSTLWEALKRLTALVMVATLADLLMPTGAMRRYARLVSGLILMLLILQPLAQAFLGALPEKASLQAILQELEGSGLP